VIRRDSYYFLFLCETKMIKMGARKGVIHFMVKIQKGEPKTPLKSTLNFKQMAILAQGKFDVLLVKRGPNES
jgi:hypothetical protein